MKEQNKPEPGVLYVVPTPIGNLADMVPRAIDILQTVSAIAAEDTRHSSKIMQHFQISTPMIAYHDHSDEQKVKLLLKKLLDGEHIALISDAGTPLVSDPGYRLVHQAREHNIKVSPIPGACAAVAALSASGLPSDRFSFEGFLPSKSGARLKALESLKGDPRTLVFYESPHRILKTLEDTALVFGDHRELVIGREISKTFETFISGPAVDVVDKVRRDSNQQKGEIVLLIKGHREEARSEGPTAEALRVMNILLDASLSVKQASALTSKITGEKKNSLYNWALEH